MQWQADLVERVHAGEAALVLGLMACREALRLRETFRGSAAQLVAGDAGQDGWIVVFFVRIRRIGRRMHRRLVSAAQRRVRVAVKAK